MVLERTILIVMHHSILITGLFPNCSSGGRVNTNKPPHIIIEQNKKRNRQCTWFVLLSFKKKSSCSLTNP